MQSVAHARPDEPLRPWLPLEPLDVIEPSALVRLGPPLPPRPPEPPLPPRPALRKSVSATAKGQGQTSNNATPTVRRSRRCRLGRRDLTTCAEFDRRRAPTSNERDKQTWHAGSRVHFDEHEQARIVGRHEHDAARSGVARIAATGATSQTA
jgi:hypothetical protein